MVVIGSFMFGFDNDSKDVFKDTIKMINKLRIDVCDFCILTPFPVTPLFNKLEKENRIITQDWSKYTMKNVVFKPKNMTAQELLDGVKQMYIEFYSIQNTVKRVFRSLRSGIYPFFLVLARNAVSNINRRFLFNLNKKS